MNARRTGLVLVIFAALVAAGLVGWSIVSGLNAAPGTIVESEEMGPAPTNTDEATFVGRPSEVQDIVMEAREGAIVGMDRNNPERIAYKLFYDTLDPQPGGRFRMERPRAWIFLTNGMLHISSEAGAFLHPPESREPQAGRFTGGVLIQYYDQDAADRALTASEAGERSDAERILRSVEPMATINTATLHFDMIIGELNAPERVLIEGPEFRAGFDGLKLNIDEPARRLAFLRTERDGWIHWTPAGSDDTTGASPRADGAGEGAPASERAQTPATREHWYRAEMRREVSLTVGARAIEGDTLELWARVLDGALPEGAIATLRTSRDRSGDGASGESDSRRAGDVEAARDEVRIEWAGPLTIRSLDAEPEELRTEHITARMTAPDRGLVRAADDDAGVDITCTGLDYAATSAVVTLTGPGASGVSITARDAFELLCGRISLDLIEGLAPIPGPGVLRAVGAAAQPALQDPLAPAPTREISWRRRADLVFATRDGSIDFNAAAPLREALFNEGVQARYDNASASGQFMRFVFAERPDGDGAAIERVMVEGSARANAGADGSVGAERIEVGFDISARDVTPRFATAHGRVRGERDGATLLAELVEATLERDERGSLRIDDFEALHAVRVTRADGAEAIGDRLRLDSKRRIVELTGEPAVAHHRGGSISAGSMRYDENERLLTVFGAGVFNYSQPRELAMGYERVQIEWERAMTYSDFAGRAEFAGSCIATASPDEFSHDVATGERIILDLTPRSGALDDGDLSEERPETRLLRATVYGADVESPDGPLARVESRRYAPDADSDTGLRLNRLVYLDGPVIIADGEENTLEVPGAGRLLIEDRRPDEAQAQRDQERQPADLRGTTLFEWDGSFNVERDRGYAVMDRRVRLRQRAPGAGAVTELECEQLRAWMDPDAIAENDDPEIAPELRRVEASGAVYAAQRGRQLIGDTLVYDAVSGQLEARAEPGNLVTLFDQAQPTPLTGSVLRWDLLRDRVEWFDAGETTAPR
ncbi:MAG: hypothetical protein EA376_07670 [Phycisphaeraceae bacterium]|nr:MAG: hypothetical protein EA376_07670 [Phycisphaeraceae bacterium]